MEVEARVHGCTPYATPAALLNLGNHEAMMRSSLVMQKERLPLVAGPLSRCGCDFALRWFGVDIAVTQNGTGDQSTLSLTYLCRKKKAGIRQNSDPRDANPCET